MRNNIQGLLNDIVSGRLPLCLGILAEDGAKIGELRALTLAHLDDQIVIEKLTEWRNQNMTSFLTHFEATPERTRNWLRQVVFKAEGQLLFLVYVNDQAVGHLGFKDLTCDDVLSDNAIRGERVGHPKLFVLATKLVIEWLFREAGVKTVYGFVKTNNVTAVMMNKQVGFGGWIRYPLRKKLDGTELYWEMGVEGDLSPDDSYCYKIFIDKPRTTPLPLEA